MNCGYGALVSLVILVAFSFAESLFICILDLYFLFSFSDTVRLLLYTVQHINTPNKQTKKKLTRKKQRSGA